jgi:hypothetical protein
VWAAAGKDPGFTPTMLLSLARRRGKYRPEDFERLHPATSVDLVAMKRAWLAALDQAEEFIESRPAEDIGCLYYDISRRCFVGTKAEAGAADVKPHHGRPGGVLPVFG